MQAASSFRPRLAGFPARPGGRRVSRHALARRMCQLGRDRAAAVGRAMIPRRRKHHGRESARVCQRSVGRRSGAFGWPGGRGAGRTRRLVRPPDALGAAHAGGRRPRQVRPELLARLLPPHPLRRRLSERRRMRGLLSHRKFRCTTAASGWATPTRSAISSPAAASWAWTSSRAPIRTPPIRTSTTRIRIGSPSTRTARSARHWADARTVGHLRARALQLRVHDRGHAGDRDAIQGGRHLQQPLGRLRHVLLRALPREFPGRFAASICRARPIRRIPRAAPTSSGSSSACSSCGGSGTRRSARSIPTACYIPNAGGGALSELDMKTIGELAPDLFADRQARSGLMRRLGERQERQGISRHHGPQADRRHLQRGRGGAVPLERFGADRRGDSSLGRSTASPTGCGPGSRSSPARCTTSAGCRWSRRCTAGTTATSATCATRSRWRAWRMVYSQQTATFYGGAQAQAEGGGPRAGVLPGADRSAHSRSRWCTTGCSTPRTSAAFKVLILPNIAALSDAQCEQIREFVERGGGAGRHP